MQCLWSPILPEWEHIWRIFHTQSCDTLIRRSYEVTWEIQCVTFPLARDLWATKLDKVLAYCERFAPLKSSDPLIFDQREVTWQIKKMSLHSQHVWLPKLIKKQSSTKLLMLLSHGHMRSCKKLRTLCLQLYESYGHQTWQTYWITTSAFNS